MTKNLDFPEASTSYLLWLCAIVVIVKGTHAAGRTTGIQLSPWDCECHSGAPPPQISFSGFTLSHSLIMPWKIQIKVSVRAGVVFSPLWHAPPCPSQAPRMRREHDTCHLIHINQAATWAEHSAVCEDAQKSNSAPPIKKLIRYIKTQMDSYNPEGHMPDVAKGWISPSLNHPCQVISKSDWPLEITH